MQDTMCHVLNSQHFNWCLIRFPAMQFCLTWQQLHVASVFTPTLELYKTNTLGQYIAPDYKLLLRHVTELTKLKAGCNHRACK